MTHSQENHENNFSILCGHNTSSKIFNGRAIFFSTTNEFYNNKHVNLCNPIKASCVPAIKPENDAESRPFLAISTAVHLLNRTERFVKIVAEERVNVVQTNRIRVKCCHTLLTSSGQECSSTANKVLKEKSLDVKHLCC